MRRIVNGPFGQNTQLCQYAETSREQNMMVEFMKVLNQIMYKDLSAYSDVLVRTHKDTEFGDAFGPMMFRLWQSTIAAKS